MRFADLEAARVAVWGAGREGRAAVAALRARLPLKRFAVICRTQEVGELTADGEPPDVITTEPDAELLRRFDVVVKSPGISPYKPPVPAAIAAGVRFVSGSALWFAEHAGARTIAVTGTKGKSTTTALVAHLLRAAGRRVALCGNIGVPLLDLLDPPREPDWWVMELSSFQIRDLGAVPEIAVVLGVFPEHLDWHGTFERYAADKLSLLGGPGKRPRASVLNREFLPPGVRLPEAGAQAFGDADGWHVDVDGIRRGATLVLPWSAIALPGRHNALNLCAALTAVEAAGEDAAALAPSVASFRALPHRLQVLGERDGLTWVNDSIATNPHATLVALSHFQDRQVTALVGGYDRGVDWDDFRTGMQLAPAGTVIAMGAMRARIVATLAGLPADRPVVREAPTLEEAMALARALTPPGGVVLLSPGAASFDQFRDYDERGRRFAALAGFDADAISQIEGLGL